MMNRIKEVLGASRVLLPVVHPIGRDAALASVEVAVESIMGHVRSRISSRRKPVSRVRGRRIIAR